MLPDTHANRLGYRCEKDWRAPKSSTFISAEQSPLASLRKMSWRISRSELVPGIGSIFGLPDDDTKAESRLRAATATIEPGEINCFSLDYRTMRNDKRLTAA